jgi:hypothetical protein
VAVDVSARYCSLVADIWFVETPLLMLDTDAWPTEDWGERGASIELEPRPGDEFCGVGGGCSPWRFGSDILSKSIW